MDLKAVIVGGSGEMGSWFFKFLAERGITVTISGRSAPVTYSEYDIVIISVPIDVTCDVISDVAPKLRPGSLLFDITSIKAKPAQAMLKFAHWCSSLLEASLVWTEHAEYGGANDNNDADKGAKVVRFSDGTIQRSRSARRDTDSRGARQSDVYYTRTNALCIHYDGSYA